MRSTLLLVACLYCNGLQAQNNAPRVSDEMLLHAGENKWWWYPIEASPARFELNERQPTNKEQAVIERAKILMANNSSKAIVLVDGNSIVFEQIKEPASKVSLLNGYSMGKTVSSMGIGKAICSGKLSLDTVASSLIPELAGTDLGIVTVRDLLRMSSGANVGNPDSSVMTPQESSAWRRGQFSLFDLITNPRVNTAQQGLFSKIKPGERFAYKGTDPLLIAMLVSRATGVPWSSWLQQAVFDPMGIARQGQYAQDKQDNGQAESGTHITLHDWVRFAVWVKKSSDEEGCFGNYVRDAMSPQIPNNYGSFGESFKSYGYFMWTDNKYAPDTVWAVGLGGQRIGWHKKSSRMVLTFSNVEDWMIDVYRLSNLWNSAN